MHLQKGQKIRWNRMVPDGSYISTYYSVNDETLKSGPKQETESLS